MTAFEIRQEIGPRSCVVSLAGDIDISVVPELRRGLSDVLESGCANIVLDLADVNYVDSSALGLFVWIDHLLLPREGKLVLAGASLDVTRILELSGLMAVAASIAMSPDAVAALEGLALSDEPGEPLWEKQMTVAPDADLLSETRETIAATISPLHFPDSALFDIKVALGEALANCIRHGTPAEIELVVSVRIIAYEDRVVLEVMDNGPGFDGVHSGSQDVYAPSGRGIMFMNALMDRVEYLPSPVSGTLVRLTKHRPCER